VANAVPTLGDVANLAGVSKSTASRILSVVGGAKKIPYAAETKSKVRAAAAKLGYKPSKLARGLTLAKTGIVGLVVPSLTDSFFPTVASAIETHLSGAGYSVILADTNADSKTERARVEDLLSWQVDGLIIAPAQEAGDAGLFWELWQRKIPFVLIDRTFPETPFFSVSTDDQIGAGLVVEHLIAAGRRRIVRVGGPLAISTNRLRHAGYTAALIRHGILPQAEYALEAAPSEEGGYQAFSKILAISPRPDAVFCFSDNVAVGVMDACNDHGIRVPEDMAVVGYADLPQSRLLKVSLTTVLQPRPLLGWHAAKMLLACMEERGQPDPIRLPVELMVRESTVGKACLPRIKEETRYA
jgi:DNA-binding LacI/PurR family transcriptional regulator